VRGFLGLRGARVTAVIGFAFLCLAPVAGATDRYVALGDSFSSGVGTGSYSLSSACKRSVYAYPYLLSQQRPGTSLSFVACSGATTADLLSTQLGALDAAPTSIVTLTIGGNDIGFANLIYQCTIADCSAALDSTRLSLEATLGSRLDSVYAAVQGRAAPGAKIVVLGYPHEFGSSSCLGSFGVSATERTKANQLADALDSTIATHVGRFPGITYASAIATFASHAVCSSAPWLNGLNLFNTSESYHPTKSGNSLGYLPLVRLTTG
jgi:lysophospholipase L1-like esterase